MVTQVKKTKDLTLTDRLSRLTFLQACDLLGGPVEGKKLLYAGGKIPVEDPVEQSTLTGDLFRLSLPTERANVTITMRQDKVKRLLLNCVVCDNTCVHMGTALSVILDSRTVLGLARAPEERQPMEALGEEQLIERALAERQLRAKEEKMTVEAVDKGSPSPWGDYMVTSKLSGKTYRVALRGTNAGDSYCTCPDYRSNTLAIVCRLQGNWMTTVDPTASHFFGP